MNILRLKNYLNCDDVFLASIIKKFIEEVKKNTKIIEEAAVNGKWTVVKLNAHKMLSSAKIFELDKLTLLLEKIEIDAETENNIAELNEDIKKLTYHVETEIIDMQTALKKLN